MQSNKLIYFVLKYGMFSLGAITFIIIGMRQLYPDLWLFRDTRPLDSLQTTIALLFGLALVLTPLAYVHNLVLVEVNNRYISVRKKNGDLKINWMDIESIKLRGTFAFPVYTIKLKNGDRRFVFNTNNHWGSLWWYDDDSSDMGQFIMAKKKELNI